MGRPTALAERLLGAVRRITGARDWPLTAAALLGLLAMHDVTGDLAGSGTERAVALLLALSATVPVAFIRSQLPVAAVTVTAATFLGLLSGRDVVVAGVLAQCAVLYLLALRHSWRLALLLVVPFAGYAIAHSPAGLLLALTAWAAALGTARRARGDARVRQTSTMAVAHELFEHAARSERARIAHELHDVVAHHVSMIAVQAETARLTTPGLPAEGARRLAAIGDTARDALTEMRRLLGVLREDVGAPPRTARRPQPGLDQLHDLIDEARDSGGASTRLIVHGRVAPLDPGVELTAYRIVQEALTNTRRHAPGAAVDVELAYAGDTLCLRVRDNGPGPPDTDPPADTAAGGLGLLGMRERAAMVGGTLRAGRAPACGFLVEAVLPTAALAAGPATAAEPAA